MTGRMDKTSGGTPRLRRDEGAAAWDALPAAMPAPSAEEFDALTDLFLGEVGARATGNGHASGAETRAEVEAPTRPASRQQPVLRLARVEDEIEADDEPVVARPAVVTEKRERTPARGGSAAGAVVECVVLGHLPVLAAAWGAQYVREVAKSSGGPVAYLRLQHGYASIELIGGDAEGLPSSRSFEDGLRSAAGHTRRWVVRADAGEEAKLAASPLVSVVTLLTGVDEAAIVAAYGSVKGLAKGLAAERGVSGPIIHVAAMGAAEEKARPAAKRLAEAIERFVGREVVTDVCGAKIASSRPSEVVFTGRTELDPGAAMELLAKIAGATPVVERRAAMPVVAGPELPVAFEPEVVVPVREVAVREVVVEREPVSREPTAPARVARSERRVEPVVEARVVEEPVFDEPVPELIEEVDFEPVNVIWEELPRTVQEPERAPVRRAPLMPAQEEEIRHAPPMPDHLKAGVPVPEDAPSALALLLPGLRPVSVRCPYAEGIEFAVDREGTVHLLSRIQDVEEQRALSELLVAGAWADAHASMIAAALGQSAGLAASGLGSGAELHLFTDKPKASRRLLETSVRVHLLVKVEVAGRSGWYCTDLN